MQCCCFPIANTYILFWHKDFAGLQFSNQLKVSTKSASEHSRKCYCWLSLMQGYGISNSCERRSKVQGWARAHPKSAEHERKFSLIFALKITRFQKNDEWKINILLHIFQIFLWFSYLRIKEMEIFDIAAKKWKYAYFIFLNCKKTFENGRKIERRSFLTALEKLSASASGAQFFFFWARAQANFLSALKVWR